MGRVHNDLLVSGFVLSMTTEQFDNYSFSIYTEIKVGNHGWIRVDGVDFGRRLINTRFTGWQHIEAIDDIRTLI
jgi:hypothetical protein